MTTQSQTHIINAPKFLYGIRIAQLVIAVAVLGLAAYGVTFIAFDGISLTLFTAIATIIITVYIGVSSIKFPFLYNYWAILGLDIFAVLFWVISFPLLASEVADWSSSSSYSCYYYYCYYKKRDLTTRATTNGKTYRNSMVATAALGGLEFLLFVITLVIFSIHLHRHRKAGGHCVPAASSEEPSTATTELSNAPPRVQTAPATQRPMQKYPQPAHSSTA